VWALTAVTLYGFSFASLGQWIFGLDLSSSVGQSLVLSREILHFPFNYINSFGLFTIPGWYADLFVLAAISMVTFLRAEGTYFHAHGVREFVVVTVLAIVFVLCGSIPLLGLVFLPMLEGRAAVFPLSGGAAALAILIALKLQI
jgi:hypothetical protein